MSGSLCRSSLHLQAFSLGIQKNVQWGKSIFGLRHQHFCPIYLPSSTHLTFQCLCPLLVMHLPPTSPLRFSPLAIQSSPQQPNPVWDLLLEPAFYSPVPASIPNQMSISSVCLSSAKLEKQSDEPDCHESV